MESPRVVCAGHPGSRRWGKRTVAIVGRERKDLDLLLPHLHTSGWEAEVFLLTDPLHGVPVGSSVVIFVERWLSADWTSNTWRSLTRVATPLLLMTDPAVENLRYLVRYPGARVLLLGIDERHLHKELCLAETNGRLGGIWEALLSHCRGQPLMATSVNTLFRQLSSSEDRRGGRSVPRIRYVRDLAEHLNCSVSSLGKGGHETGIDISRILKWALLLEGLMLRGQTRRGWSRIARDVGFSSGSSWSAFVQRNFQCTPTEAIQTPVVSWIRVFRDTILPGKDPASVAWNNRVAVRVIEEEARGDTDQKDPRCL